MKKAKRVVALLLAVLVFCTSDSYLYQVLAEEAPIEETTPTDTDGNGGSTDGSTNQTGDTQGGNEDGGSDTNSSTDGNTDGGALDANQAITGGTDSPQGATTPTTLAGGVEQQASEESTDSLLSLSTEINGRSDLAQGTRVSITSGEEFTYRIDYSASSGGGKNSVTRGVIRIPIPAGMEVKKDPNSNSINPDVPSYLISGVGVLHGEGVPTSKWPRIDSNTNELIINLDTFDTGELQSLEIIFQSKNFEFANGQLVDLQPRLTANVGTTAYTADIKENRNLVVGADDGWQISKQADKTSGFSETADGRYYVVPYTLTVNSAKPNGFNSNGRQSVDYFVLEDTLPTLAAANTYSGYPSGGEPVAVQNVYMKNASGTVTKQLNLGDEGYTLEANGSVLTKIKFHDFYKATATDIASLGTGNKIIEGSMMPTTYTVEVLYKKDAYEVPAQSFVETWKLTNTAKIDYSFINDDEVKSNGPAQAVVELGKRVVGNKKVTLNIEKYLRLGNVESILTGDLFSTYVKANIEFKLYDSTGNVAKDAEGNTVQPVIVNTETGLASFADLAPGTYYIEEIIDYGSSTPEINVPEQKDITDYIKVTINENGVVTVESKGAFGDDNVSTTDNYVKVINESQRRGAVHFFKYGYTAGGSAQALNGVKFILAKEAQLPYISLYEATSKNMGEVRFDGIPITSEFGTERFYIYEVNQGEEYPTQASPIGFVNVTPSGLSEPLFTAQAQYPDESDVPENVFVNVSEKGKFEITKVNADDVDQKPIEVADNERKAIFKVYGPFTGATIDELPSNWQTEANVCIDELVVGAKGTVVSKALAEGNYVLVETQAPKGYGFDADNNAHIVTVSQNGVAGITIGNYRDQKVIIEKKGYINKGSGSSEEVIDANLLIDGASFRVWSHATSTDSKYLVANTFELQNQTNKAQAELDLPPGTYYIEEVSAPVGFEKLTSRQEIVVEHNAATNVVLNNYTEHGTVKIEKVDSVTDELITSSNARFKLYKVEDGKDVLVTTVGDKGTITTDQGVYLTHPLPPGTYKLVEVAAPNNYIKGADITFTVEGNKTNEVTVENTPQVSLKITKKDSVSNVNLSGVSFELYDGNTKVGKTLTTNAYGICTFTGLTPGKSYTLKEVSSKTGYSTKELETNITMPESGSVDYTEYVYARTILNKPLGDLILWKTTNMDQTGTNTVPLQGAKFSIYSVKTVDGNKVKDSLLTFDSKTVFTTGSDGKIVIEDMEPGEYFLVEVEAAGHTLAADKLITIAPGQNRSEYSSIQNEITVNNVADKGKFTFNKIDSKTNVALVDASFTLYGSKGEEGSKVIDKNTVVISSITTDAAGYISDWLAPGTYFLVENDYPNSTADKDYTVDKTPIEITIEAGKTNNTYTGTAAIKNVPKGRLFVEKYSNFNVITGESESGNAQYGLSGATISIYKAASDNSTFTSDKTAGNKVLASKKMDSHEYTSLLLDEGWYWVHEELAPDGYKLKSKTGNSKEENEALNAYRVYVTGGKVTKVEASEEQKQNYVKILNETDKGRIVIDKVDVRNHETKLPKAGFVAYEAVGASDKPDEVIKNADGENVYLKKAEISDSYGASGDKDKTYLETKQKGDAKTILLEAGKTYYFREVTPPDDYSIKNEWSGPYTVTANSETIATIENNPESSSGGLKKSINEENEEVKLEGVYFAAFNTHADAKKVWDYLKAQNYEFDNTNRASLRTVLDTQMASSTGYNFTGDLKSNGFNEIVQIVKTDANGKIAFNNLPEGTYYVIELVPLDSYSYDFNDPSLISTMTVSFDSKTNSVTYSDISRTNRNYGWLQVSKVTMVGGKEVPVNNVLYRVYATIWDEEKEEYVKDSAYKSHIAEGKTNTVTLDDRTILSGIYTSIALPAGTYIVEEVSGDYEGKPTSIKIGKDDPGMSPKSGQLQVTIEPLKTTTAYTKTADNQYELKAAQKFTNTANYGNIAIKKEVLLLNNGNLSKDETFTYEIVDKASEKVVDTVSVTVKKDTKASDIVLSALLPAGKTYIIREKAGTFSGYIDITGEKEVTVVAGKTTGWTEDSQKHYGDGESVSPIIFQNEKAGELKIIKVGKTIDSDGTTYSYGSLEGVTFNLYHWTGDSEKDKDLQATPYVTGITTGKDGVTVKPGLKPGKYWLVETSTGSNTNYVDLMEPMVIEITRGSQTPKTIENLANLGRFKIRKVDNNNLNLGLNGAKFTLYKSDKKTIVTEGLESKTVDSEDGWIVSDPLAPGTYWLKETAAPGNYRGSNSDFIGPIEVTKDTVNNVSDSTLDSPLVIKNERTFNIVFDKLTYDENGNGVSATGAEFTLYRGSVNENNIVTTSSVDEISKKMKFSNVSLNGKSSEKFIIVETKRPTSPKQTYLELTDSNKIVKEFTVNYSDLFSSEGTLITTIDQGEIINDWKGSFRFKKLINFNDSMVGLENVQFEIYKVAAKGTKPSEDQTVLKTVTTKNVLNEEILDYNFDSGALDAGWYALKELPINGFTNITDYIWFEVNNNEITHTYFRGDSLSEETDGILVNGVESAKYFLEKFDGKEGTDSTLLTSIGGAKFYLFKYDYENEKWNYYGSTEESHTVNKGGRLSGYLEHGMYKVVEAPDSNPHLTTGTGASEITYDFDPDSKDNGPDTPGIPGPQIGVDGYDDATELGASFVIDDSTNGTIINLKAYNNPLADIVMTKYGDNNNDGSYTEGVDSLLDGAKFRLYLDKDCENEYLRDNGEHLGTVASVGGKVTFANIRPGTYYIKEDNGSIDALKELGYLVDAESVVEVVVPEGLTLKNAEGTISKPTIEVEEPFNNPSMWGSLLIKKIADDDNSISDILEASALKDSKFSIYIEDGVDENGDIEWKSFTGCPTITSNDVKTGKLIEMGDVTAGGTKEGTWFKIVETKAPAGYSLDKRLHSLEQIVFVKPNRVPTLPESTTYEDFIAMEYPNACIFLNTPLSSLTEERSKREITKGIKDQYTDEFTTVLDRDAAGSSYPTLQNSDYKLDFLVGGFAEGDNKLPSARLYVEDGYIFESNETYGFAMKSLNISGIEEKVNFTKAYADQTQLKDFNIDGITLYKGADDSGKKIIAKVEVVQNISENSYVTAYTCNDITKIGDEGLYIDFSTLDTLNSEQGVYRVRVSYEEVDTGFTTNGFILHTTFNRRDTKEANGEYWAKTAKEIRRIANKAKVTWLDEIYNEDGHLVDINDKEIGEHEPGENSVANSNEVVIKLPSQAADMPKAAITHKIDKKKSQGYVPGSDMLFEINAKNQEAQGGPNLVDPIISFVMPPSVTFDANSSVVVRITDNVGAPITGFSYRLIGVNESEKVTTDGAIKLDSSGNPITSDKYPANHYIIKFTNNDGSTFELPPGANIKISYKGLVKYEDKTTIERYVSLAYLTSGKVLAPTFSNPKGTSFFGKAYGDDIDQSFVNDPLTDGQFDPANVEREYLRAIDDAGLATSKIVTTVKEYSRDGVTWHQPGEVEEFNAGEELYYRLTVRNDSSESVERVKLLDVLPYSGDHMATNTEGPRGTTIPDTSETIDEIRLEEAIPNATSNSADASVKANFKTYYYVESGDNALYANTWATDSGAKAKAILGSADASSWNGWSESMPTGENAERKVTAVGFDITFGDEANPGLPGGDSYSVIIKTRLPEFTRAQIDEFNGKLLANSVSYSSKKIGEPAISGTNIIEPDPTIVKLTVPKGKLGDYVWEDRNGNGLQDDEDWIVDGQREDPGINNAKVTLYRRTYRKNENGVISYEQDTLKSVNTATKTEADGTERKGYYEFDNLNTNTLREGLSADYDKEDPTNYIGNVLYKYYIKVESLPSGYAEYTPTERYGGNETPQTDLYEVDSNIDSRKWQSEEVALMTLETIGANKPRELYGEENMTLDAGFTKSYSLGDTVWLDVNGNGLYDEDPLTKEFEEGVEGVAVKLYKVGKDGKVIDKVVDIAYTNAEGKYLFTGLLKGNYVVEFDISNFVESQNVDGLPNYRYTYSFTKASDAINGELDSNACYDVTDSDGNVKANGRIKRSPVIKVDESLDERGYADLSWDAGVIIPSALGGYVFDDKDYDDLKYAKSTDQLLPLVGTKVYLYEVDKATTVRTKVGETTIDGSGRYYFDNIFVPKDVVDSDTGEILSDNAREFVVQFVYPENYRGVKDNANDIDKSYDARDKSDSVNDSDVNYFENEQTRNTGEIRTIKLPYNTISTTWDAGARLYSEIGDYVWIDSNRDGVQGPAEEVKEGIGVVLQERNLNEDDQWSEWKDRETTLTDTNGKYKFSNLESSDLINKQYRVVFVIFEREEGVTKANSRDDVYDANGNLYMKGSNETDSDGLGDQYGEPLKNVIDSYEKFGNFRHGYVTEVIKPDYGENDYTWDCGLIPYISALGDYMWYDDNYDGIQDANETPVKGARVVLEKNELGLIRDESEWKEVRDDETGDDGYYFFGVLDPGHYRVRFFIPEAYTATKYNRGAEENSSSASRRAEENSFRSHSYYLEEGTEYPHLDAGVYKPQVRERTNRIPRTVRNRRVRSGDNMHLMLWVLVLAGSAGIVVIGTKKRKKVKKH
ncbi:putative surface anchored protein [Lachnospiraceae bacterium PF1-21]